MTVEVRTPRGIEERTGLEYLVQGDIFRIRDAEGVGIWRVATSEPYRREHGDHMIWAVDTAPFIESNAPKF